MQTLSNLWYSLTPRGGKASEDPPIETNVPIFMLGRCLQLEDIAPPPPLPPAEGSGGDGGADRDDGDPGGGTAADSGAEVGNGGGGDEDDGGNDGRRGGDGRDAKGAKGASTGAGTLSVASGGAKDAADPHSSALPRLTAKLLWCTYRSDFPAIGGDPGPTSDSGWGCMIRCGQMLVGEAISRLSGSWGEPLPSGCVPWFLDDPEQPYSIHKITLLGEEKWGKRVGEWFGPSTISVVLSELVGAHAPGGMASVVFPDMAIYKDEVRDTCTVAPRRGGGSAIPGNVLLRPRSESDRGGAGPGAARHDAGARDSKSPGPTPCDWRPVLLWLPVRLGVDEINPIYVDCLLRYFRCPQSVGVIGGKVKHALYFHTVQGQRTFYLDPHTVQPSVPVEKLPGGSEALATFTTSDILSMNIADADPSMAIAFLCTDEDDFESLCHLIEGIAAQVDNPVIRVLDTAPPPADIDGIVDFDSWSDDDDDGTGGPSAKDGSAAAEGEDQTCPDPKDFATI